MLTVLIFITIEIVSLAGCGWIVARAAKAVGSTLAPFGAWFGWQCFAAAFALLLLKPYVVETFVIPTASMSPTIEAGDRFVANKVFEPQRFDIVTFRIKPMRGASPQAEEIYCKRLIGLLGEQLRFDGNGGITINGQLVELPPVVAGRYHASPASQRTYAKYADGETITLGPDEIFLIGDNVDLSADSRTHGPSKQSAIVGVVDFTYWPLSRVRVFR